MLICVEAKIGAGDFKFWHRCRLFCCLTPILQLLHGCPPSQRAPIPGTVLPVRQQQCFPAAAQGLLAVAPQHRGLSQLLAEHCILYQLLHDEFLGCIHLPLCPRDLDEPRRCQHGLSLVLALHLSSGAAADAAHRLTAVADDPPDSSLWHVELLRHRCALHHNLMHSSFGSAHLAGRTPDQQ